MYVAHITSLFALFLYLLTGCKCQILVIFTLLIYLFTVSEHFNCLSFFTPYNIIMGEFFIVFVLANSLIVFLS